MVRAIDVNTLALGVFRANWTHASEALNLDSIATDHLAELGADLWWLSPPCQPYTCRGNRRDLDDPRARSLVTLLDRISIVQPRYVVLENVVGFAGSRARRLVVSLLSGCGYREIRELFLCPSQFGVPNRRPRFYLVASRRDLLPSPAPSVTVRSLATYIDPSSADDPGLRLGPELVEKYSGALHILDAQKRDATTRCFTSAYGRSPVRSGSYLRLSHRDGADGHYRIRRFSPREILSLFHFPPSFQLPENMPLRVGWRLVGNSLSILPVRLVLSCIPELWNSAIAQGS